MDDETANAEKGDQSDAPLPPAEAPPVADVVKRTLLELAEWQETTRRIAERVRTSKVKPPGEPPELIG